MGLQYNVKMKTFDIACDDCKHSDIYSTISECVATDWGIMLHDSGYVNYCLCPDCKVEHDLEDIRDTYGDREDLSYNEIAEVQRNWYYE